MDETLCMCGRGIMLHVVHDDVCFQECRDCGWDFECEDHSEMLAANNCPRCMDVFDLHQMSHAPRTWVQQTFPSTPDRNVMVCRPCKRILQDAA